MIGWVESSAKHPGQKEHLPASRERKSDYITARSRDLPVLC